jgi:serine/threonine-protein kinase
MPRRFRKNQTIHRPDSILSLARVVDEPFPLGYDDCGFYNSRTMTQYMDEYYARYEAQDAPNLPEQFQCYRLNKDKIGEGPVGFSYRAIRTDTNSPVRLKVMRRRLCERAEFSELFHRQGRVLNEMRGEHILRFERTGAHGQILFYEFDYIGATSLREIINVHAPLHPDLAALITVQTATALNQIHGIRPSPGLGNLIPLHRNLKPENILVTESGRLCLTDVDMRALTDFADRINVDLPYSLQVYASPEQLLKSGFADRRSDIYSLGLILFEMLTGGRPFTGQNVYEVRQNIREDTRLRYSELYPVYRDSMIKSLLKQLSKLAESMIAHEPERRPGTIVDIEGRLQDYFHGSTYDRPEASIADFLRVGAFQSNRSRKRGFIDKLFGR